MLSFVFHVHLAAAAATDDQAHQEGMPLPDRSPGAQRVLAGIITESGLMCHKGLPLDVGRIDALMDDGPLLWGEVATSARPWPTIRMGTMPPIDEGASIGGVVHDLVDDHL